MLWIDLLFATSDGAVAGGAIAGVITSGVTVLASGSIIAWLLNKHVPQLQKDIERKDAYIERLVTQVIEEQERKDNQVKATIAEANAEREKDRQARHEAARSLQQAIAESTIASASEHKRMREAFQEALERQRARDDDSLNKLAAKFETALKSIQENCAKELERVSAANEAGIERLASEFRDSISAIADRNRRGGGNNDRP